MQLLLLTAGAFGGLYLMALAALVLACALCAMTSAGSPLAAPVAPHRRHGPDILLRLPLKYQKARAFFARQSS